jgi:UDP-N-acetylglucosamine 1-carboxyvinyltransferase
MTPILNKLKECGCKLITGNNYIHLEAPKKLTCVDIKTMPYPGFPTDMQSVFTSILTVAKGTSTVTENIFENRYKYTSELNKMKAKISIDENVAIIKGARKLKGAEVIATDLRGGAAEVLAGLVAKGKTRVNNIEHILRGYENLDKKLNSLGAKIERK